MKLEVNYYKKKKKWKLHFYPKLFISNNLEAISDSPQLIADNHLNQTLSGSPTAEFHSHK